VILDPTMTPTWPAVTSWPAQRGVARAVHAAFAVDFYQPSRVNHGSYYFDWTTWDEAAWRNFYRVWMAFLNDYKNWAAAHGELGRRLTSTTPSASGPSRKWSCCRKRASTRWK